MQQLSIVLPYYNPPPGWELRVWEAYQTLQKKLLFHPELIVVNDGSLVAQDKALDFLKSNIPNFRATGYGQNMGKGAALRHGVALTQGAKIIYTDIDFPYTTESCLSVWEALQGQDIVIGIKDKTYYQHLPRARVWISKFLRKMIGLFFRMPITDTQCGLKGFNQKGKMIFLATTIDRYLCDLEFVYKSFRTKPPLKIAGREVRLRDEVAFRKMDAKVLISEFFNFLKILRRKSHL